MEARREFVLLAKQPGTNMSELCAAFGVSRKTGYKWLKLASAGVFEDRSRRPVSSPLRVSGEVVARIVELRTAHPFWGPKKLATLLRGRFRTAAPSPRTVARILERCGLMQPVRRLRPKQRLDAPTQLPVPKKPNDLWTVDFKGWWLTPSKQRCEPLTVRDAYSRFILAIDAFDRIDKQNVREVFERLFTRYGVPRAIQSDNGPPFVSANTWHGLSALSVWWTSLGIEHVRSRPGKPSDNGGHERMHRDIAYELERFSAFTLEAQQRAFDRWRHDYNKHRPHEALGMRTPASVYRRSSVGFTPSPPGFCYPDEMLVRYVANNGSIKYKDQRLFLSETLSCHSVGLEPTEQTDVLKLWLGHRFIGLVDFTGPTPIFRSTQPKPPKRRRSGWKVGNTEGRPTGT